MYADKYVELVFNKEPFNYRFLKNENMLYTRTILRFLENNMFIIGRADVNYIRISESLDVSNKDCMCCIHTHNEDVLTGIYETNRTPIFELLHTATFLMNGVLYIPDTTKPSYVKINRCQSNIYTDDVVHIYQDYTKYGELIDYMERIGNDVHVCDYDLPVFHPVDKYYYASLNNVFVVYKAINSRAIFYLFYNVDSRLNNLLTSFVKSKNGIRLGYVSELSLNVKKEFTKICDCENLNKQLRYIFKKYVLNRDL